MKRPIYLEHNVTTPVALGAANTILPFLDEHLRQSFIICTLFARQAIADARASVLSLFMRVTINHFLRTARPRPSARMDFLWKQ